MGWMRWTRFGAVAMATLITGSMAIAAQDAPEAPKPDAPSEKPAVRELDPNKAPEGKFKLVTVSDLKLTDAARKKDLGLVAIFPEEAGKYPVVIYSHGAGGSNANVPLAQYIASHGYVVLVPSHADSREAAAAAQLETMFQQYDTNKDGKIAKEELPEMIQGMFDTLDGDGDGFLSKEELSALAGRFGGGGRGQGGGRGPAARAVGAAAGGVGAVAGPRARRRTTKSPAKTTLTFSVTRANHCSKTRLNPSRPHSPASASPAPAARVVARPRWTPRQAWTVRPTSNCCSTARPSWLNSRPA